MIFVFIFEDQASVVLRRPDDPDNDSGRIEFPGGWVSDLVPWVCRRWYEVAINTPRLWTVIVLARTFSLSVAASALERSKSLPLHIAFNPPAGIDKNHEWLSKALCILKPHLWRCQDFTMKVDDLEVAASAMSDFATLHSSPRFKSLSLLNVSTFGILKLSPEGKAKMDAFGSVVYLALKNMCLPWDSPVYANLLRLTISYIDGEAGTLTTNRFENILRGCPLLEYLELEDVGYALDLEQPIPLTEPSSIVMGSLKKIKFVCIVPFMLLHIAGILATPVLKSIVISELDYQFPFDTEMDRSVTCEALVELAAKCSQSLSHLTLDNIKLPLMLEETLTEEESLFHRLPHLKTLGVLNMESNDGRRIFHDLFLGDQCQELTSFTVERCEDFDYEFFEEFQGMLGEEDRAKLERLVIKGCGSFDEDEIAWFRERVPSVEMDQ